MKKWFVSMQGGGICCIVLLVGYLYGYFSRSYSTDDDTKRSEYRRGYSAGRDAGMFCDPQLYVNRVDWLVLEEEAQTGNKVTREQIIEREQAKHR